MNRIAPGSNTVLSPQWLLKTWLCFFRIGMFIFFLITFYPTCIDAQTKKDVPETKLRRVGLSVHTGFASSGPAKEIEELMIAGGFNANDGLFGIGGKDHPYSLTGIDFQKGVPWLVSLSYLLKPPFALGIVFGQTKIGSTYGFHKPISMDINYSVTAIAPVIWLYAWQVIQLGIGVAKYYPDTDTGAFGVEDESKIGNKFGLILDFDLAIPAKSHFFFTFKMQFRKVGEVEIGPFESESLGFTTTLPEAKVNFNHWFFGVGFGIGK